MARTRSKKTQQAETWKAFSRFIRIRDCIRTTGTPFRGACFTCGRELRYGELQAGHIISRSYSNALYNPNVVFAQCVTCNYKYEGNHVLGLFMLADLCSDYGGYKKAQDICYDAMGSKSYDQWELEDMEDDFNCLADSLVEYYNERTGMNESN